MRKNKKNSSLNEPIVEEEISGDALDYIEKIHEEIKPFDTEAELEETSTEELNLETTIDNITEPEILEVSSSAPADLPAIEIVSEVLEEKVEEILTLEQEVELINEQNKQAKKRISEIKVALREKENDLGNLEIKIEFLNTAYESLSSWYENKSKSFTSKFLNRLSEVKSLLDSDEFKVRDWLSKGIEIDINFIKRLRTWFVKRYLISLLFAGVITLIIFLFDRYNKEEFRQSLSNLSLTVMDIYAITWIIYLLYLLGLLFSYSRKLSRHRRELSIASSKAAGMLQSLDYIKDARLRIDSLHPQMEQYLHILSAAIHTPWKVPNDLLNFTTTKPETEYLPESLDIAAPYLGPNDNEFWVLVNKTVSKIFVKGWRALAFEKLVAKMSENAGVSISTGEMDRDARRHGLRSMFIKLHDEGINLENDVLIQAAREKIKEVIPIVQKEILPSSNLKVSSVKIDPLDGLEISDNLIDSSENNFAWDEYLALISGYASPWSPLVFSNEGILRGRREKINRSFILGNSRLAHLGKEGIDFIESLSESTRPVDLLLRVDLSNWCSAGEVKVFEGMPISDIEANLEEKLENSILPTEGTAI
jgi:hypothetical protein